MHSFIHSFIHLFIRLTIYSVMHACIHLFIHLINMFSPTCRTGQVLSALHFIPVIVSQRVFEFVALIGGEDIVFAILAVDLDGIGLVQTVDVETLGGNFWAGENMCGRKRKEITNLLVSLNHLEENA